ncbi:hypothetical protein IQ243_07010 [Nostocales cyanobacterium LEGE 11386]|nr:hypothetical protein [Nostocales cyanobacterium LEGE 11386]
MKLVLAFNQWQPYSIIKFFIQPKKLLVALGIVVASVVVMGTNVGTKVHMSAQNVYPQGKQFPLALYSLHEAQDMQSARKSGWKIAQTYHFNPAFLQTVTEGQMLALASLPGKSQPVPEARLANNIATLAKSDRVAWWEFPEERRYWRDGEMAIVTKYAKWTRKYDPKKRPNYMYIPGHYNAQDVQQYVPYLDIIPASVYTKYVEMPHSWVRWRMETTLKGIELAQAKIGANYLKGEKTPVAVLELFHEPGNMLITPEGAYHDFWQSIVSGARGILVFSYFRKRNHPQLEKVWQVYDQAVREITGKEQLGAAILYGKRLDNINFQIIDGPKRTEQFIFSDMEQPISFPSINILTLAWNKSTYIIAVNSADEPVSAKFTGFANTTDEATVLFANKTICLSNGTLNTVFKPLGVQILKISMDSKNTKALEERNKKICKLLPTRINGNF